MSQLRDKASANLNSQPTVHVIAVGIGERGKREDVRSPALSDSTNVQAFKPQVNTCQISHSITQKRGEAQCISEVGQLCANSPVQHGIIGE